jgi:hypothetical protein
MIFHLQTKIVLAKLIFELALEKYKEFLKNEK